MSKNYKIGITLRLEEDLHMKITYIAEEEKRSLNAAIEFAVQQYIKSFEAQNGEILIPK